MTKRISNLLFVALTATVSMGVDAQITEIPGCYNTVLRARFGELCCDFFPTGMQLKKRDADGPLSVDEFGGVLVGDSIIPIGTIDASSAGPLRTDHFGHINAGNSILSVDISPIVKQPSE